MASNYLIIANAKIWDNANYNSKTKKKDRKCLKDRVKANK